MVEPALDHTAKTQFEGTKEMASRIATAYSSSPLAERDGAKMETDDYIRKNEFQNMDHASDGRKKLSHCREWKKEVITEDTGTRIMKALESGEFVSSMSSLTPAEIEETRREAA